MNKSQRRKRENCHTENVKLQRHKEAVNLIDICKVSRESEATSEWKVQSQSNKETYYSIIKSHTHCSCKLKCSQCGACSHMYNCSCIDYALHSTVCKHIHLVQIHTSADQQILDLRQDGAEDQEILLESRQQGTGSETVVWIQLQLLKLRSHPSILLSTFHQYYVKNSITGTLKKPN